MTEEALDPRAQPEEGSAEARPRPRRRRRGGRGRSRGRSSTRPADAQGSEGSPPEAGGDTQEAPAPEAAEKPGSGEAAEQPRSSRATPRRRSRSPRTPKPAEERTEDGDQQEDRPAEGAGGGDGEALTSSQKRRRRRRRRKSTAPAEAPADGQQATREKAEKQEPAEKRERKPQARKKQASQRPKDGQAKRGGTRTAKPEAQPKERSRPAPTRTSRAARKSAGDRRRRQPQAPVPRRTDKAMLITEHHDRLQIAVVEGRDLVEHYVAPTGSTSMVGNVYLGKVQNVLPGMEAAFVDIGRGRNGVLYAGEVSYDEEVDAGQRRIEAVLKAGQAVLVQVTKDPMRGKGARLTAQVSLPGRYLVYVPDGSASGISRRLPDKERERLRKIIREIRPSEAGVIVRTAAEDASQEELAADLDRLKKAWDSIKRKSRRARAPKMMYEEPELVERVVRDVVSPTEFREIVTDSPEVHQQVRSYMETVAPDLLDRLQLHEGPLPLFEAHHISEQIHKALERKIWLPSGGYLYIDRVEAMTVIDVNSGKHVGKSNLEQTVLETNLEAATEIARQLRLRDIGGIIVIDFIDMLLASNRAEVVHTLQEALAQDKTRSQVFDITHLGLLEMTRKKVSAGLLEAFSETCPTCEGRGILLTHDV